MVRRSVLLLLLNLTPVACTYRLPPVAVVHECPALAASDSSHPDTLVYDTLSVTQRPVRASSQPVRYPEAARQEGVNGHVVIDVVIDAAGRPEMGSARVVAANYRDFVEPSLAFLRGSRFCPGTLDGRAVRVRVRIPIDFTIERVGAARSLVWAT